MFEDIVHFVKHVRKRIHPLQSTISPEEKEFPNSVFSLSIFISFLSGHRLLPGKLKMSLQTSERQKSECKHISHGSSNGVFPLPYSNFVSLVFTFTALWQVYLALQAVQYRNTKTVFFKPKTLETLNNLSVHSNALSLLSAEMKRLVLSAVILFNNLCNAKCYNLYVISFYEIS